MSKIHTADPPKRGLRIEALTVTPECPRTFCATPFSLLTQRPGRFGANFLRLSNFPSPVKLFFALRFRGKSFWFGIRSFGANIRAAQNLKDQPAQKMPEPILAHGNKIPGSCNGLFSEGFPTEGPGENELTRPCEPASHFPLRAGPTATGRLHCSFPTFQE